MKHFFSTRISMLTIIILLGAIPVAAVERPFASNGNGTLAIVTDGAGNVIGGSLTASGTATHLGLWTASGAVEFAADFKNPSLVHPTGTITFTAANGDKLEGALEDGVLDVNTGIANGTLLFVGGTGRFEGASGSVAYVVSQNLVTGAFEITTVGRINF
ncbi:MAG TPA: hypothetical protein VF747_03075 [Blastocatellia bacterium]